MNTKVLELGEYRYTLTHAPARAALHVCARLGNAGSAFFAGLGVGRGGSRMTNAIAYMMQSPELSAIVRDIVDTLMPYTQIGSVHTAETFPLDKCIDQHFAGRMRHFMTWIETAIEFECGDFLEDVSARVAEALKKAASASTSPETSSPSGNAGA